jgi:hypothetical protein
MVLNLNMVDLTSPKFHNHEPKALLGVRYCGISKLESRPEGAGDTTKQSERKEL